MSMSPRAQKVADLVASDGLISLLSEEAVAEHEAKARDIANLWCNGADGARICILAALLRAEITGIVLAGGAA